jgi:hypothetical protein
MTTINHTYPANPVDGRVYTDADYKIAAEANLFFARMERKRGNTEAAAAYQRLARTYIKQELDRDTGK